MRLSGVRVRVLQVVGGTVAGRLRGRLERPAGWISIVDMVGGYRWARPDGASLIGPLLQAVQVQTQPLGSSQASGSIQLPPAAQVQSSPGESLQVPLGPPSQEDTQHARQSVVRVPVQQTVMASPTLNPGARREDRHEATAWPQQPALTKPHRPKGTGVENRQDALKHLTARSEKLRAESKTLQQSYQQRLDRLEALLSSQRSAASLSVSLDGILARHTTEARLPCVARTLPSTAFPDGMHPDDQPPNPNSARYLEQLKRQQQRLQQQQQQPEWQHMMPPTRGPQHPDLQTIAMPPSLGGHPTEKVPVVLGGSHVFDLQQTMPSSVGSHMVDPRQRVASPVTMHRFRNEQDVRVLDNLAETLPTYCASDATMSLIH